MSLHVILSFTLADGWVDLELVLRCVAVSIARRCGTLSTSLLRSSARETIIAH